jgi:hypothetical protein
MTIIHATQPEEALSSGAVMNRWNGNSHGSHGTGSADSSIMCIISLSLLLFFIVVVIVVVVVVAAVGSNLDPVQSTGLAVTRDS